MHGLRLEAFVAMFVLQSASSIIAVDFMLLFTCSLHAALLWQPLAVCLYAFYFGESAVHSGG